MFITRKRYEAELAKAKEEGFNKAMEQQAMNESFRYINDRIDRLIEKMDKPKTVHGFGIGVIPGA